MTCTSQPSWAIEGSASIQFLDELETLSNSLEVKFYGDLVLPKPPANLEDAILLSQEIPSLCEESKGPTSFSIVPISEYCSEQEKILNEITAENIEKVYFFIYVN